MDTRLTTKQLREQREFETLFKNPKHARQMWAQTVFDRYSKPAIKPILIVDKDGVYSKESQIEQQIWCQLEEEQRRLGIARPISDGEFVEACQAYYSRHSAASYTARRDTMGAKPIDETKNSHQMSNPYENLSDEQLIVIQEALAAHATQAAQATTVEEIDYEKENSNS